MVLLHGLRASSTMWRRQAETLTTLGRRVAAPDFPGHGRRRGERFTLQGALDAVSEAAEAVSDGTDRVLLVGQSLGGYVGLHWAARATVPLAGVLAAACSTEPSALTVGGYRLIAGAIGLLPDSGAWLNDRTVRWAVPPEAAQDLAAGGFALDVMQDTLREVRRLQPIDDIRRLGPTPVWILNGARDHFRLQERALLAAAGNGRLLVVPGAKHLVSLEAPVPFTRAVLEMLAIADRAAADDVSAGRRELAGAAASAPAG